MSTIFSVNAMSHRVNSEVRTGSTSIMPIIGKGSRSVIPRDSRGSSPAVGLRTMIPTSQCGGLRPSEGLQQEVIQDCGTASKTLQGDVSGHSNPGDQTPRSRSSALPTLASRRAVSKSGINSTTKSRTVISNTAQKRQLENQFATKKQKYMTLRKELADKQKLALELYEDVTELREKSIAAGLKDPGKIEKVAGICGTKSGAKETLSVLCEGDSEEQSSNFALNSVVTSDFMVTLEEKLHGMPNAYLEMCKEALRKRAEVVGWMTDVSQEKEPLLKSELLKWLEVFEKEGRGLETRLENVAEKQQSVVNELLQNTSALWGEHESYRIHIREMETSGESLVRDLREKLRTTIEELTVEREKVGQLKDRKNSSDVQLQKTRTKIRELEGLASSNDAKIQQLQGHVKSLENQMKQKDVGIEARAKEMQKAIKNSEILLAKTEKQRDSLESRVTELKKKIDSKETEFSQALKNVTTQLNETKDQLETEKDLKCQAEAKVEELSERCAKLEEKSKQLCELAEESKSLAAMKPVDEVHTENEIQLWNELQETRSALAAQEEKLLQVQREKENVVALMHQAADHENPASVKDKLAADLVTKTEELRAVHLERAELQKSLKAAIEKSENFERQLSELQAKLHAQSKEGGKMGWGAHAIELQQQLSDLRSTLAELQRHNQDLESALTQKQLEIEQRDRTMREQSKVLKVRDELIGLLKGHSPAPNGELSNLMENGTPEQQGQLDPETIGRLVNKQIAAKAEDLQAVYSTLESKQMQLMRLEKVVRQMEADNDRSQATRTKLEREVAQLRLQLHEKNRDKRLGTPCRSKYP